MRRQNGRDPRAAPARAALLLCVALLAGCRSTAPEASEREVRRMERVWLNAYERRDAEAMRPILADGFTITYPNGAVETKSNVLALLARHAADTSGPRFHTEETAAHVYGRTVILTGRVVTEQVKDGAPVVRVNRYTDTWVRLDGRWQVAASQLSNVE